MGGRGAPTPGRTGSTPPHPGYVPRGLSNARVPSTSPGSVCGSGPAAARAQVTGAQTAGFPGGCHHTCTPSPEPALFRPPLGSSKHGPWGARRHPGADQPASDVALRPRHGLGRFAFCGCAGSLDTAGGPRAPRGRTWAAAVHSPGRASAPGRRSADSWLTCPPGAPWAAAPQTPRAAGAGRSPAQGAAAARPLGERRPARLPPGPTPRPPAGGRSRRPLPTRRVLSTVPRAACFRPANLACSLRPGHSEKGEARPPPHPWEASPPLCRGLEPPGSLPRVLGEEGRCL